MAPMTARCCLAGLLLTTALAAGCNPASFFMLAHMLGADHNTAPECPLIGDDKEQEVKVVILSYSSLETRPEFLRVDHELASLIAKRINEQAKLNKESLTIVSPGKVQKFKDDHPNWKAMGVEEIGEHFGAAYVIDLAIDSITLYEPGSNHNTLLHGRAAISVKVFDVAKPDEDPLFEKEYSTEYPRGRPVEVDFANNNVQQFRLSFLTHIATDLAWLFVAHPTDLHHSLRMD